MRLPLSPPPQTGMTPLYIAAQNGCLDVLQALIEKGVDLEAKQKVIMPRQWRAHTGGAKCKRRVC